MKSVITKSWFRVFLITAALIQLTLDLRSLFFKPVAINFQGSIYSSTNILLIILVLIAIIIRHHQLRGLVWFWSLLWLVGNSLLLVFLLFRIARGEFIWDMGTIWVIAGFAFALAIFIGSRKYILKDHIPNKPTT